MDLESSKPFIPESHSAIKTIIDLKNRKGLNPSEVVIAFPELTRSVGTLANWRNQKRGPKYFIVNGGKIVYRPSDIESYLFAHPVLTIDCNEVG